ncbi:branched-chain amino acid ABC transporter permease [Bacteriovorax stolpii]|uniref:branched-chain amino acid ABC transporter permease n=1 Tax=Bacteriovorax stolpii TaxID=960 RepID=UPI00115AACF5|nr:branched-chain amino acid ABC transporter permease [Bacteriovorax stolpii]QDK41742.1 branched-chain amino acid ABC transporter permease [Bacteriovorax stolpii]
MDYYLQILTLVGIFITLTLSLNLINGYCGQFSLGHAGFWGVGAYASAVYGVYFALPLHPAMNMVISMGVGFFAAALCGLLIGVPCLRLKGDYLAIATIGFSEILRIIIMNTESIGGPRGFTNIPKWTNGIWVWGVAVIVTIFMLNLKKSAFGRAIISIREDEIAAETMGINLFRFKLFSFIIGAGIAGIAGSLVAHDQQFLHPNNFNFMWSVCILVMVILGGQGSVTGSIVGAVILTLLPEVLKFIGSDISTWRMSIYSALMVILMLTRPQGIFGPHEFSFKRGKLTKGAA